MLRTIILVVFIVFATLYLREPIRCNLLAGFALIAASAALVFAPWLEPASLKLQKQVEA